MPPVTRIDLSASIGYFLFGAPHPKRFDCCQSPCVSSMMVLGDNVPSAALFAKGIGFRHAGTMCFTFQRHQCARFIEPAIGVELPRQDAFTVMA